jgi:2-polyprenyl-6-methoxyphenol hydroxylase-like FAD-dependent oxidoreductase
MVNDRRPIRVAVIGAGVVGCLVVRGLQQEEAVEVFCIDKGAEDNVLAGTGLNVGPNAMKVLQQFDPELMAALCAEDISLPWSSWIAGLTDGTVMMDLPLSKVAENPGIRIRWSDLYRELRSHIAGRVRYHTTVVEMGYTDASDDAPLYLVVEDQQTGEQQRIDQVDLIVGCDGRYSQVRRTFIDNPTPEHLGVCVYRLLVPNTPDRLIDDYQQWFYNGCRLLAFAIPGDEVYIAGSFPL